MPYNPETPFRVHVRPDPNLRDALVLQFEVFDGLGVLGLRKPGWEEPPPTTHWEELELEPEYLRAGRFVHVLAGGQRQSYALSRITPEVAARLPEDQWTELQAVTEYGFRYLVVPEELTSKPPAPASIAVGAEPRAEARFEPAVDVPASVIPPVRPQPVAKVKPASATPAESAVPPRQVPMDPELAASALDRLSREEALAALQEQMARVDSLHRRVDELTRLLEKSQSRERDLLQLLQRWQQL